MPQGLKDDTALSTLAKEWLKSRELIHAVEPLSGYAVNPFLLTLAIRNHHYESFIQYRDIDILGTCFCYISI